MRYIMVTNWDNHWDKLPEEKTRYRKKMFKGSMCIEKLEDNTSAIFIKRNKGTKKFERAWEGKVTAINPDGENISFNVNLESEIECPAEYKGYTEGWYLEEDYEKFKKDYDKFSPSFFSELKNTSDWSKFEEYVYSLIKCLGISDVYRFPQPQKGEADGFFLFEKIVVLYDCTLDDNFEDSKKTQIGNFCSQLGKDHIEYRSKKFTISDKKKSVWIITRGKARLLKEIDGIKIKEITVSKLIDLYKRRLTSDEYDSETLERELLKI